MDFSKLATVEWTTVSAFCTFCAVLVALFYQPFLNRRKVRVEASLSTHVESGVHAIKLVIINAGEKPIWITTGGLLYEDGDHKVFKVLGKEVFPKKMEPTESIVCSEHIMEYNYKIKNLYAKDSLGKFWYMSRKARKEFDNLVKICQQLNPPLERTNKPKYVAKPKLSSK